MYKLSELRTLKSDWVHYKHAHQYLQNTQNKPSKNQATLCISAGRKTHIPMLRLASSLKAMRCVLMTPKLPRFLFDAIICPRHDRQKESKRLLNTKGPLVKSLTRSKQTEHQLILVGGPSKHYRWSDDLILRQIQALIAKNCPLPWRVIASRRTPTSCQRALQTLATTSSKTPTKNTVIFDPNDNIEPSLQSASQVWVTPDSSNMLFEAMSSGCPTGVLELPSVKKWGRSPRLSAEIETLKKEHMLIQSAQNGLKPRSAQQETKRSDCQLNSQLNSHLVNQISSPTLDEASRAATWLLDRYQNWRSTKRHAIHVTEAQP